LNPRLASTSGTLHLGPMHIVFEAAATELAAEMAGGARLQAEAWDVLFVAPGRVGPFVTSGDALRGRLGRVAVRLALHDEGNPGRVVARCFAVFRPAF